ISIAFGETTASSCEDCHGTNPGTIHHGGADATNGLCVNCHKPDVGRGPEDETGLLMTTGLSGGNGLPCGWCHLYWGGGNGATDGYTVTSTKVQIFSLTWAPTTGNAGDAAGRTALPSHAVSENETTPISNFAACFSCHGATAATKGGGKQVTPFHGFGSPYTGDAGGNNSWAFKQRNIYMGPTNSSASGPLSDESRHPGLHALNALGGYMEMLKQNCGYDTCGKAYYDGGGASPKKIFENDAGQHNPSTATYTTTFDIPWDNFLGNPTLSAPQDLTNFDFGGVKGNITIPTTVPQVPLSLP
ncbi:MAG: hypothetical protein QNK14_09895, partial [Desulfobacterales bacterium]|nr:hypothetical protein [Desulfobacterales bacterium]